MSKRESLLELEVAKRGVLLDKERRGWIKLQGQSTEREQSGKLEENQPKESKDKDSPGTGECRLLRVLGGVPQTARVQEPSHNAHLEVIILLLKNLICLAIFLITGNKRQMPLRSK